jgi:hypothetical protein
MEGLLSLLSGEKVVMRNIFVAAVAAVSALLANVASADGCNAVRRPLVTVAATPVGAPVLLTAALIETN